MSENVHVIQTTMLGIIVGLLITIVWKLAGMDK